MPKFIWYDEFPPILPDDVSNGKRCAWEDFYGLYTKVSDYIDKRNMNVTLKHEWDLSTGMAIPATVMTGMPDMAPSFSIKKIEKNKFEWPNSNFPPKSKKHHFLTPEAMQKIVNSNDRILRKKVKTSVFTHFGTK